MSAKGDSDEKKLQKVKAEIRSLLISSPSKSILLNQFLRDFQKNIGKPLPFKDFSYNSPLQFLSSLTDVVQVIDAYDGARLAPVTNELSCHISEMVEQQKKTTHRKPPVYKNNMAYYSPISRAKPPQPYASLMSSYTSGQPLYNYGAPAIPPLLHQPFGNWRQLPRYQSYGFTGQPTHYNYAVDVQQYPSVHPSSVPYADLRGVFSSPSGDRVTDASVDNRKASTNNTSEIEVAVSDEKENGLLDNGVTHVDEPVELENNSYQISQNHTSEYESADCHSETENSYCTITNPVVDQPVSKTDDNVVDHSSLDVQSSGQENQNFSSLSETSKCSDIPNGDVKSKIWAVLEKHSNGVPSSSFLGFYKSLHSCSLDISSLGYSSLKEMVLKNEDIFSFEKNKASDDWILYDARLKPKRRRSQVLSKWIPHCVVDNLAALAQKHQDGIDANEILIRYKEDYATEINPEILGFDTLDSFLESCKSVSFRKYGDKGMVYPKGWGSKSCDTKQPDDVKEPALPPPEEMKFLWKEYFKEYECDPSFKFKPPSIPDDKLLQVKIVDLHSPALMWIQFLDDVKSLNDMMCRMNLHYDSKHQEYIIPENFILPDLAVASMFAGKWHRANIISVNGQHAQVLYIDYGTTCTADTSELRKLDKMFGQDRVYAIKASLFCLIPYYGDEWSVESCDFLYNQYADKIVYAELCSVNYQEPFVEVIFFDTSKGGDVNINDLLVSKKLARYMTNPVSDTASILNERSITTFYKFLPRWFSTSDKSDSDIGMCCKNLMLCTSAESIPIESDVIPCCKLHCIQTLCQANAEAMALIWERAIRQEEERILNNVMSQVEDTLKEWGWESCLTSELCCVDKAPQADPLEILYRQVDVKIEKEKPINTEIPAQPADPFAHMHSPHDDQSPRTVISEPNNLSKSKSPSMTSFHQVRTPGNRNIRSHRNDPRFKPRPRLMYPRVIRYVDAQFRETVLTLIVFRGEIRVCLSQLFQLTKLPSMLAKKRLEISDIEADFIVASRKNYPDLYNDLHDLELIFPEGDPILVLLSDAPKIIRAVDPLSRYKDTFENLAKEVAPYLDELLE